MAESRTEELPGSLEQLDFPIVCENVEGCDKEAEWILYFDTTCSHRIYLRCTEDKNYNLDATWCGICNSTATHIRLVRVEAL